MRKAIIAWLAFEAVTTVAMGAWPWAVFYLHAPNLFHLVPDFLLQPKG
jgi:hypothetical protein